MSIESMAIALHHSQAKGVAKLILLGIANHDGDGGSWPSRETLAKYGACKIATVTTCLLELEKLGEISREVNAGGKKGTPNNKRPNLYHFLLHCPAGCDRSKNHRVVDEESQGATVIVPSPESTTTIQGATTIELGCDGDRARVRPPSHQTIKNHQESLGGRLSTEGDNASEQETTPPYSELGGGNRGVVHGSAPHRPDACDYHQAWDYPPPCGACARAKSDYKESIRLEHHRAEEERRAAKRAELAEMRRKAAECTLCDADGYLNALPCTHDPHIAERNKRGAEFVRQSLRAAKESSR